MAHTEAKDIHNPEGRPLPVQGDHWQFYMGERFRIEGITQWSGNPNMFPLGTKMVVYKSLNQEGKTLWTSDMTSFMAKVMVKQKIDDNFGALTPCFTKIQDANEWKKWDPPY